MSILETQPPKKEMGEFSWSVAYVRIKAQQALWTQRYCNSAQQMLCVPGRPPDNSTRLSACPGWDAG